MISLLKNVSFAINRNNIFFPCTSVGAKVQAKSSCPEIKIKDLFCISLGFHLALKLLSRRHFRADKEIKMFLFRLSLTYSYLCNRNKSLYLFIKWQKNIILER